ncbi:cadherin-like beta sandwich domain-containing protein [Massilia sp. B-10]|nr:cadherin-like beta sandwich domain-containing protein [Massilia sp. B-10]
MFASGTTSYTASVGNATTQLTVTPTRSDANASITVNGVVVASGTASGALALNVGSNVITTVVTAQDGTTTKTYTVTVTRAGSANADLSALSLSSGTLAPVFASGTTSYTASVGNATTSLTVTPTRSDANASITVNGVAVVSGTASGAIALNVGSNVVTTIVTAQDGTTTRTYTVTVTRAASGNADLSALSLSSGALAPSLRSSHHRLHRQRRQCHWLADRHADQSGRQRQHHGQWRCRRQRHRLRRDRAQRGRQPHHHHGHRPGRHHQELHRDRHPPVGQCRSGRPGPVQRHAGA